MRKMRFINNWNYQFIYDSTPAEKTQKLPGTTGYTSA